MSNQEQNSMFINLDSLVKKDHPYRKLDKLLDFYELSKPYHHLYSDLGRKQKGVEFGLRCLMLQFTENRSNREMERFLQKNVVGQWFCKMCLGEKAPDHSYFGAFRKLLGT